MDEKQFQGLNKIFSNFTHYHKHLELNKIPRCDNNNQLKFQIEKYYKNITIDSNFSDISALLISIFSIYFSSRYCGKIHLRKDILNNFFDYSLYLGTEENILTERHTFFHTKISLDDKHIAGVQALRRSIKFSKNIWYKEDLVLQRSELILTLDQEHEKLPFRSK